MIEVIHYTKNPNFVLRAITIQNGYRRDGLPNKPLGGLWCSPLRSKWGWKEWCKLEPSHNSLKGYTQVILKITKENMLVINSLENLNKLPTRRPKSYPLLCINFEALVQEGIHSIYLTENGLWETRFSHPLDLYPWDCETILIMNIKCIRSISTPIYTQVLKQAGNLSTTPRRRTVVGPSSVTSGPSDPLALGNLWPSGP